MPKFSDCLLNTETEVRKDRKEQRQRMWDDDDAAVDGGDDDGIDDCLFNVQAG